MSIKRTIMKPGLFLTLGLIINILFAWGCALFSPMSKSNNPLALTKQEVRRWIDRSPWPHKLRPGKTISSSSLGLAYEKLESQKPEPHFWHVALAFKAGYPLPSLYGERWSNFSHELDNDQQQVLINAIDPDWIPLLGNDKPTRVLPWRPIWPGFLTNTVFFGGACYFLSGAVFAIRGQRRYKHQRCPRCNDALIETPNASCKSCGWRKGITNAHFKTLPTNQ